MTGVEVFKVVGNDGGGTDGGGLHIGLSRVARDNVDGTAGNCAMISGVESDGVEGDFTDREGASGLKFGVDCCDFFGDEVKVPALIRGNPVSDAVGDDTAVLVESCVPPFSWDKLPSLSQMS